MGAAKTMAEVIRDADVYDIAEMDVETLVSDLTAAGFGLVADTKRDAAAAALLSVHDIWGSSGRSIVRMGELRDSATKILAGEWDRHIEWNHVDIARERIRAAARGEG